MLTSDRMALEDFLSAPIEDVRPLSPQTLVLGAGGTRRRAVLAGSSASSAEYASWTRREMMACLEMLFRYDVKHILAPLLIEGSYRETTPRYREELVDWVLWGLGDADALEAYKTLNWRVRLLGSESWPELTELAARLEYETGQNTGPFIWFSVMSRPDLHWELVFKSVLRDRPASQEDAIRSIYGECIPPATLYLGSGKPDIVPSVVPPLLIGNMQCYWRQSLGYDLDERTFRHVLYDYAFARRTWRQDKTGRADEVQNYAAAWESPPLVGLGFRLGPFWYPAPFSLPPQIDREHEKWTSGQ